METTPGERPLVAQLLDLIGAAMNLSGPTSLQVDYTDDEQGRPRARAWGVRDERNSPYQLARYDEAARDLLATLVI